MLAGAAFVRPVQHDAAARALADNVGRAALGRGGGPDTRRIRLAEIGCEPPAADKLVGGLRQCGAGGADRKRREGKSDRRHKVDRGRFHVGFAPAFVLLRIAHHSIKPVRIRATSPNQTTAR